MATIRNFEISSEEPGQAPPVMVALADLRGQRWPQAVGRLLYDLKQAIQAQVEYVGHERVRILEIYTRRDDEGTPVTVKSWADVTDRLAFQRDFQEVLDGSFTVTGLPWSLGEGKDLLGDTWAAPIWEFAAPAAEKKGALASADGGGSSGGSAAQPHPSPPQGGGDN